MGYINGLNQYPQYQGQYAQSFGMTPSAQQAPQFAGLPTPQSVGSPEAEPSLMQEIFNPFNAIFLPLTLMDENVKNYIKESSKAKGVEISRAGSKKIFGFAYQPKFNEVNKSLKGTFDSRKAVFMEEVKGVNYKGILNKSVHSLYSKETLYKSLAKEGKTAQEIFDIVHGSKGLGAAEAATKAKEIGSAIEGVTKSTGFFAKMTQKLGTGTIGKALRGVPGSAVLFGLFEIPNVISAAKYGTGETIKQVGRSTLNAAGNIMAFTAGTEAGAAVGSAVGTVICPGVGTLIGGAIGGLVGGIAASHVVGKVTKYIGESIFGKPKAEQEEKQQALLAQQQAAQQATTQQAAPQTFGSYTPSFQGTMPSTANFGVSLGDDDMLSRSMSAYNQYQMIA
jgi:hypothetical protein